VQIIGGGSDLNNTINLMNNNIREIQTDQQTRIIRDDEGTRVVILDKDGIRTTKPGDNIDVVTATNSQLTFNSAQKVFKIAQRTRALNSTYVAAIVCPANQVKNYIVTDSYSHGLSFAPQLIGSILDGSTYLPIPFSYTVYAGTKSWITITFRAQVTTTTLSTVIDVLIDSTDDPGGLTLELLSFPFYFYLLQETAN
jgi:hypothetical protein